MTLLYETAKSHIGTINNTVTEVIMPNDTPKTTIYIQAIITTDAVPDFSFFNQLSNAKDQVGSSETSPLMECIAADSSQSKPRYNGEREGDPNKPITGPQIKLVKSIIDSGKFTLPNLLEAYHVSSLSQLTDEDVQKIVKESKKKSNPDYF